MMAALHQAPDNKTNAHFVCLDNNTKKTTISSICDYLRINLPDCYFKFRFLQKKSSENSLIKHFFTWNWIKYRFDWHKCVRNVSNPISCCSVWFLPLAQVSRSSSVRVDEPSVQHLFATIFKKTLFHHNLFYIKATRKLLASLFSNGLSKWFEMCTLINFIVFDSLPISWAVGQQIIFDLLSLPWDRTNCRCYNLVRPKFGLLFHTHTHTEKLGKKPNSICFGSPESTSFCFLALFIAY